MRSTGDSHAQGTLADIEVRGRFCTYLGLAAGNAVSTGDEQTVSALVLLEFACESQAGISQSNWGVNSKLPIWGGRPRSVETL